MKLNRTLIFPVAVLLLVGVAGVALAATATPAPSGADKVVPAADATPKPAPSNGPVAKDSILSDVLDKLVTKGTISEAQKTAILDALKAERTARQTERQAARQLLKDILSDGVITKAELDKLPADSPLRKLTTLMDDGKITLDELRGLGRGFMGKGGFGGHGGWRGGPMFDKPDASASPSS